MVLLCCLLLQGLSFPASPKRSTRWAVGPALLPSSSLTTSAAALSAFPPLCNALRVPGRSLDHLQSKGEPALRVNTELELHWPKVSQEESLFLHNTKQATLKKQIKAAGGGKKYIKKKKNQDNFWLHDYLCSMPLQTRAAATYPRGTPKILLCTCVTRARQGDHHPQGSPSTCWRLLWPPTERDTWETPHLGVRAKRQVLFWITLNWRQML